MNVPTTGRPTEPTTSDDLAGKDGNAYAIMGTTKRLLLDAGASRAFVDAYLEEAQSGDYDHLLVTSIAFLDAGQE